METCSWKYSDKKPFVSRLRSTSPGDQTTLAAVSMPCQVVQFMLHSVTDFPLIWKVVVFASNSQQFWWDIGVRKFAVTALLVARAFAGTKIVGG